MFILICLLALAGTVLAQTSVSLVADSTTFAPEHSPRKALLLSLLPGAGQVYNGQAWKIPIIYGAFAGVGYFVYDNYTKMRAFKDEYLLRIGGGEPQLEGYMSYPNTSIYNLYQSYNKNFQLMVIITGLVYGLNLIDAYVFGHLYEFQINDDLSLHVSPNLMATPDMQISAGFSCQLHF